MIVEPDTKLDKMKEQYEIIKKRNDEEKMKIVAQAKEKIF